MTQTNYRREFWQTIYAAYVGAANAVNEKGGANWADLALKALDERFPTGKESAVGSPFFNLKEINEEAKLLTELLTAIGELKNIASDKTGLLKRADNETLSVENRYLKSLVDQYSAQLADYRKGGPAKDIEIERLTREGLIKDQKLKEAVDRCDVLEKQLCKESADYEKRIGELEALPMPKTTAADLIRERDKRIAELEKKIEDLLAPAVVSEQPKPRTAIEWLEDLPEPYRSQALANAKKLDTSYFPNMIANDLATALDAFYWDRTPEGESYWHALNDKLLNGEPLVAEEKPTTVKGWLELLEEPYRRQALKNAEYRNYSDTPINNMADAINTFAWDNTPEGWDYWNTLHEKYSAIQDPPQQSNNKNHEDLPF